MTLALVCTKSLNTLGTAYIGFSEANNMQREPINALFKHNRLTIEEIIRLFEPIQLILSPGEST